MDHDMMGLVRIAMRLDAGGHHGVADMVDDVMSRLSASTRWWDTSDPEAGGFHGRMLGKDSNTGGDWFQDPRGNYWYREGGGDWKQYVKKDGEWTQAGEGEGYKERGKFLGDDVNTKGKWYQDEVGNYWYKDPSKDDWVQYEKGDAGWAAVPGGSKKAWKPYAGKMLGQDPSTGGAWYVDEAGRHWYQEGPGDPWKEYAKGDGGWNPVEGGGATSSPKTAPSGTGRQTVTTKGGNRITVMPDGQAYSEDGRPVVYYNGNWYNLGDTSAVDKGAAPLFKDDSATSTESKAAPAQLPASPASFGNAPVWKGNWPEKMNLR